MPENFQQEYFTRLLDQFARHLQPMPGVEDILQAMTVQYCLASSSNPQRLKSSLVKCNMETLFDKRTFAAAMVKNAKPAPDLFLYAAEHMKVAPARCLVIEDSEMGVRAAQAAGMAVWHFAGGAHVKAGYRLPENLVPDRVVVDMAEMHQAFSELGICRTV